MGYEVCKTSFLFTEFIVKVNWRIEETCFQLFVKNIQYKFRILIFLVQLLQNWTGCLVQEVRKDTSPKMWWQIILGWVSLNLLNCQCWIISKSKRMLMSICASAFTAIWQTVHKKKMVISNKGEFIGCAIDRGCMSLLHSIKSFIKLPDNGCKTYSLLL